MEVNYNNKEEVMKFKVSEEFKSVYANIETNKNRSRYFARPYNMDNIKSVILNRSIKLNDNCFEIIIDIKHYLVVLYLEDKDGYQDEYPRDLKILPNVIVSLDAEKDKDGKYIVYIDTEVYNE